MAYRVGSLPSVILECQEAAATPLAQLLSWKMATAMALNKNHSKCSQAGDTDMDIAIDVVTFVHIHTHTEVYNNKIYYTHM